MTHTPSPTPLLLSNFFPLPLLPLSPSSLSSPLLLLLTALALYHPSKAAARVSKAPPVCCARRGLQRAATAAGITARLGGRGDCSVALATIEDGSSLFFLQCFAEQLQPPRTLRGVPSSVSWPRLEQAPATMSCVYLISVCEIRVLHVCNCRCEDQGFACKKNQSH